MDLIQNYIVTMRSIVLEPRGLLDKSYLIFKIWKTVKKSKNHFPLISFGKTFSFPKPAMFQNYFTVNFLMGLSIRVVQSVTIYLKDMSARAYFLFSKTTIPI
jgi:hypothetical protein